MFSKIRVKRCSGKFAERVTKNLLLAHPGYAPDAYIHRYARVACSEAGEKEFSDGKRTYGRDSRRRKNAYIPTTVRPAPSRGGVRFGNRTEHGARRGAIGGAGANCPAIHLHQGGRQRRGRLRSQQF